MSAEYPGLAKASGQVAAWLEVARGLGEGDELRRCLQEVLANSTVAQSATAPVDSATLPGRLGMIGSSPGMTRLFDMIERVAQSSVPVLIHGETGSGKELVARALHDFSPRAAQLMLAENCAAIAPNLLESELFGHVRGAFTDAAGDRKGTFEAADGGTVFLDEIGDMPAAMQAKLLRVLQDGEIRPVGATRTRKVDVRIVAASHRDLVAMVAKGEFRQDLLFRLNVITLEVPPLRERREDIPDLCAFLLGRIAQEEGRAARSLSSADLAELAARDFPGNVRELENVLRRAVAMTAPGKPLDLAQ